MMNFILRQVLENNAVGQPIVIHVTDSEVCIGRKFKISLEKFPQISRHHATIYQTDDNCIFIKDEGSLNGTFVNDVKIAIKKLKSLCVGDRIGFGIPCDQPDNGLVCIVCCDEPPYQVKDEVIVISDDDEVHANNNNNNDDVNNVDLDSKIVKCTSSSSVPLTCNDGSRISATVGLKTENASSFPNTFVTKARKTFVYGSSTNVPRSSLQCETDVERCNGEKIKNHELSNFPTTSKHAIPQRSYLGTDSTPRKSEKLFPSNTAAETHSAKKLNVIDSSYIASTVDDRSINLENGRHSVNRISIESYISLQPSVPGIERSAIRKIKVEDDSDSISTFSNYIINSTLKKPFEDKVNSLQTDRKLSNNNVEDSFVTKKLKSLDTTCLGSLSAETSINSHLQNSAKGNSSRTYKTSFHHTKSAEISAPKTVNNRNVINSFGVNVKDSTDIQTENNTIINRTDNLLKKHIEATKFVNTTSLTSVPYSSKHNSKRKSSIESLPLKECVVYLVKCDSDTFQFPPDVKNPFLKKHNSSKSSVEKHVVKQNSQSSKTHGHKSNKDVKLTLNPQNELFQSIKDRDSKTTQQCNIKKRKAIVDDQVLDTYSSKKICSSSKKNEKEFSIRHTKKQLHYNVGSESDSDDNEITNYSQVEEVIDITDDDIYFDFQSSQNFVYIKKERDEIEDDHKDEIEDDHNNEIYAEIFESDRECLNLHNKASKTNSNDSFVESIEAIKAFVGCNDKEEQKKFKNSLAEDNNCLENSFFPVLSQNFESDEENSNSNNSKSCSKRGLSIPETRDSSEEEVYYKEETLKNRKEKELSKIKLTDPKPLPCQQEHKKRRHEKNNLNNQSKSHSIKNPTKSDAQNSRSEEIYYVNEGIINQKEEKLAKIKLIEPKPLSYRPRYKKGRDEDFVERSKPSPVSKFDKKSPKDFKKRSPTKGSCINTQSNLSKFKIPRKRALPQSDQSLKQFENEPNKDDSAVNNLPGSSKKSLSVKRRPEKFASRMGFLVNEVEINPRRPSKPVSKVPGIMRQNSSSLLGIQNNSANNIHYSTPSHQSSASIPTPSSASILTQSSASTAFQASASTAFQASTSTAFQASASTAFQASASTAFQASASTAFQASASTAFQASASTAFQASASTAFQGSASNSVQNSAISVNALKKPIDSLQISTKDAITNPRDPRQNRVAHSSNQPATSQVSTSKISSERNFSFQSENSNNQFPDTFRNNYPNNLMVNSLRFSVIRNLIKLQTAWLQEQRNKRVPPPAVYEGADYLQLRYKSYEAYISSFCPMFMLELWEQMYVDSQEIFDTKKQYKKFYFSILSYTSRDDCIELKCESVVNDKVSFCPREGNIVILELRENAHRCSPSFGYIFHHKVQPLDLKSLKNLQWKKLPKESGWLTHAKHWTFLVYVKKKDKPFAVNDLMKGNGLSYIGNKMRLLDAMSYLKNSPLLDDFLWPKWNTFLVNYSKCSPTMEYNTCQSEVINGVSAEINKSSDTSKIVLLQGPPGTGKTHTIIGLLQKLIHSNKFSQNFKVLVAAPSNAAIDEIGGRLIEINNKFLSPRIKFVRIGSVEQVNPKMKPFFIDAKARHLYENDSKSAFIQKKGDLQMLRMQIDNLRKEPYSMHNYERIQHLEDKYKLYYDSVSSKNMDYYIEMDYKRKILKESHIILSTLSSCGLNILLKTFKPNSGIHFSCCIVDECTQCTELEILQPLVLGINKLILVGDHKQLPATVTSKLACKYGFERSAFERFHLFFEKFFKKTPMYTLSEQFRMHSAICEFPSKYIYDKKIVTHPDTDLKYKNFPFHPYFLLDILVSQESDDSSSKINCTEASVIVNICSIFIEIVDSSSIGIITPYQAQKSLYLSALNVNPRYKNIEVNTVDGFQGREKDIIILSSVRANSQSGSIGFLACKRRLNVAITRARKCLIICAHADSLMNNLDWRELIFDAKRRNVCVGVPSPKDIPLIFKYNLRKDR